MARRTQPQHGTLQSRTSSRSSPSDYVRVQIYETVPIPEGLPLGGGAADGAASPPAGRAPRLAGPAAEGAGASSVGGAPFLEAPPTSPRSADRKPGPHTHPGAAPVGDSTSVPSAGTRAPSLPSRPADVPGPQHACIGAGGGCLVPSAGSPQPGSPEREPFTDGSAVPPPAFSSIASEGEGHAAGHEEGFEGAELRARQESVGSTGESLPAAAGAFTSL